MSVIPIPRWRSQQSALASWVKRSLSMPNGNCVEVASMPGGGFGVRDSKHTEDPILSFTPGEWHAFLGGVRNGEFGGLYGRQGC
jgi:hypothetical protein